MEVRSVSPRTVLESEKAMAASAAESHRTVRRALPRVWGSQFCVLSYRQQTRDQPKNECRVYPDQALSLAARNHCAGQPPHLPLKALTHFRVPFAPNTDAPASTALKHTGNVASPSGGASSSARQQVDPTVTMAPVVF